MPNTRNVDERIVEMRLDNKGFEEGAHKTISTLEKLERALHLKSDSKAFDDMASSVSKFDASPMVSGLEKIKEGFTAMEIVGMRVISNLTDSVYNFASKTIKSFTIDPIMQGMGKFGEKTTAVSTLTAQGYELEKVNKLMEDLNWFTDETSYNFTDMVGNIAKFTATGQDLDSSVTAMEGIALWAAVSGQNAQKASMAMYQLSQAMGKGALKYDDYKSIQNASMDTQEFRQQAAAAAVELGYLKKSADGVWETTEKTAKANQAFDLAGLFSSDALSRTSWLSSEVMMNVFNRYSRAVGAVKKYLDDHADTVELASEAMRLMGEEAEAYAKRHAVSLDEAFKQLGYDMDEFSLKALKAGQNARTWGDVVDSVKDAVSTGWMSTFEHLFGDAETATKFWTDIANRFYDIFAEGGNTRNSILKMAFGKGSENLDKTSNSVKNLAGGWSRLEKRLESSGKTMADFRKELIKVSSEAELEAIRGFNGIDDALKNGGVSAELFKRAMESLLGVTDEAMSDTDQNVQHATHSLQEMRDVAIGVLRGDFGNGEERRKAIEEMGYDFELIQAMAGQLKWGGLGMSDEKLIQWMELYYQYNHLGQRLGANSFAEYLSETADAANEATESIENFNDLYEAVVHGIEEVDEATGKAMTGGEYFRAGILNIIDTFSDIQGAFREGFTQVFGEPKDIAVGLYKLVKRFYEFTNAMRLGEGTVAGLTTVFTGLLSILKGAGSVFGFLVTVGGYLFRGLMSVADAVGTVIAGLGKYKIIENFGKAFTNIFEALKTPLELSAGYTAYIFNLFKQNVLPGFMEKLGKVLGNLSAKVLELSEKFKSFLESEEVADKISTAFGYLLYYLKAIRNGFKDFDLAGELERVWTWINNIFTGVKAEDSDVLLALEEISDTVEPISRAIMGDPTEVKSRINTFFKTVKDSIKEQLDKFTFSGLFNALKVTAMTIFLAKIAGLVEQAKNLTKNISSIPEAIAGTINKAGDVLVAFRKKVMADAYIKIAAAIGILAASLWVLSKIPRDDLTHAATVITVLMLALSGIVKVMGGFGSRVGDKNYNIGNALKINVFNGLAAKLIGIAAVLGTVVAALLVVRKMNPTLIVTTLIGVATIIGGLALTIKALSELPQYNAKGVSLTLVSLAFALQMLMLPMAELALFTLDPSGNAYMGAIFGVIALVAALTGVIAVFSKLDKGNNMGNVTKMAASMSLIALAISLLIIPLGALAVMPGSVMGKAFASLLGLSLILGIMAAMAGNVGGMDGANNIIKIAGGMVLFAVALNMMIPILGAFAGAIVVLEQKYSWEKIKDNLLPLGELAIILTGFAFAAILMGAGLSKLGSGMLKIAGSFLLFSLALVALSFGLEYIGNGLPVFVEGLAKAGDVMWNNKWNFLLGIGLFAALAVALGKLAKGLAGIFKLGNAGGKLTMFTGKLAESFGGMLKTFGKKLLDNMPSLLQLIGAIVVLAGLYLLDIIPQMTEIAVNAISIFLKSLSTSIENNRDQFVDSITSIITTLLSVAKEVLANLWNETSPFEKILLGLGVLSIVASSLSKMLIGTNGAGGIVGAFRIMTGGVEKSVTTMAASTTATVGTLFWWLLAVAAVAYGVYDGVKRMNKAQAEQEEPYLEGHDKDLNGYLHALENATKRYTEAKTTWEEEFDKFSEGASDKTYEDIEELQRIADAEGAAVVSFEDQLRRYLELSSKDFNKQLADAGGNYSEMEAVKQKLAEIKQASDAAAAGIDAVTKDTGSALPSKEEALESLKRDLTGFYTDMTKGTSLEAGEGGAEEFSNSFMSWIMGEEGSSYFSGSGTYAADKTMNGLGDEMRKYMPNVSNDTVDGFLSNIYGRYQDLFDGGAFMYDALDAGYRYESNTNSPSVEMQKLGGYAVDGLVLGILNQSSDLDTAGATLADNLISTISDAMAQVAVVANDEFQISPNITPVVDSTSLASLNAQEEYGYWNDISKAQDKIYQAQQDQRQDAVRQTGEMISLWDEYAVRADEIGGTVEYSLENSKMSGLVSDISNKVDALGQQMANMQVVLDSGLLVGGIAGSMDRQLGTMSMRRGRGN